MVFACNLLRASANAREYEEQVRIGDKMGALQNVFSPNLSWRTMISSFFSAFDQFRTMTPIDVVDILVVAYIIYRVMKLLKDTSAARLAKGILILVLIMLFASFLHLTMISWLLRNALSVGVFAVVVIFQPELRRLLEQIGKGNLSRMLIPDTDPDVVESMIVATVSACADMSRTKTGALIVFERKERLGEIIATGTRVDAASCSTRRSRSQAPLCLCTLQMVSNHSEGTFERLRYSFGGDRPSQTPHLTLSHLRVTAAG